MYKLFNQNKEKTKRQALYLVPSFVSVIRVLFAVLLVTFAVNSSPGLLVSAVFGVPLVMFLDAVDGMVARRYNVQTLLGSFVDIAADRLVEFIFIQYFVSIGLVPLWFILIFYGRIFLTDICRILAFRKNSVSPTGILLPPSLHSLVLSKLSRSGYAAIKGVFFSLLLLVIYREQSSLSVLEFGTMLSVLVFSLLRATPILITYLPFIHTLSVTDNQYTDQSKTQEIVTYTTKIASWLQVVADICLGALLIRSAFMH
jgi:CDP-diacylglycerol---glycerol-3-phosphate 3-phosphatidyltransferase